MQAINQPSGCKKLKAQTGVATVEFAISALLFFILVFGVIEVARAFYLFNTLQEVTRRAATAAASTDFSNTDALAAIRRDAIFRNPSGRLAGASDITDAHVRIEYLSITRNGDSVAMAATATMPSSPAENRVECMKDPNSTTCIRLVRVRICMPGGGATCQAVPFQFMVPLIKRTFPLPKATTIKVAESLGFVAGSAP